MFASGNAAVASDMAARACDNYDPEAPAGARLLARAQVEALAAIAEAVDRLAAAVEAAVNR